MLFRVSDIAVNLTERSSPVTAETFVESFVKCKVKDALTECFPSIEQGKSYDFVSLSEWSTHELVFHLLSLIGPASLYVATWSMSETPARMLVEAMQVGVIRELHCLFDYRIKVRYPGVHDYVQQHFTSVGIGNSHAKVTVLINDTWAVRIVGSSNYTNNPRIEAGVLSAGRAVCELHREWIMAELKGEKPFEG
ncbi:MAG: hypothetical protein LCH91_14075 [Bacteroidetes bacterium]|nr:hypothetical protein [Bacteroidota bacterium]